jgi:hypothetical protein
VRRASHRDKAEPDIVKALEGVGASVTKLSAKGVPDLLVGYQGTTYLLEVKTPGASKGGNNGRSNAGQSEWRQAWRGGPVFVVETPEQALWAIGVRPHVTPRPWTEAERAELIPAPRLAAPLTLTGKPGGRW